MQEILTAIGTIIGVAGVVFLKDWAIDGRNPFKKKDTDGGEYDKRFQGIEASLKTLAGNHLEHIQHGINSMHKKQDESLNIMREWDKFGIPVRDCEKKLKH